MDIHKFNKMVNIKVNEDVYNFELRYFVNPKARKDNVRN